MFGAIKEIPETIKSWSENREQLYNVIASVAAALVVTAFLTGARPSESLAVVARGIGLSPVADWLTTTAPPFLAARVETVNDGFLVAALLLFAVMVVVPLLRGWRDDNDRFAYELLPLLGAPSAGTTWLLLLVAAQYGDIARPLHAWAEAASAVVGWTLGGLVVAGVLYLVAARYGWGGLARFLLRPPAVIAYRVFTGIGFAGFAVILAAVSIPLSIMSWFLGLESDRHRRIRAEIEQERLDREPVATGAAIVRLDGAA
jgi:hypothetical protein